jgi:hypothetical protein
VQEDFNQFWFALGSFVELNAADLPPGRQADSENSNRICSGSAGAFDVKFRFPGNAQRQRQLIVRC